MSFDYMTLAWLQTHRMTGSLEPRRHPYPGAAALTISLSGPGSLRVLIHLPMKCAVWFASLPFLRLRSG